MITILLILSKLLKLLKLCILFYFLDKKKLIDKLDEVIKIFDIIDKNNTNKNDLKTVKKSNKKYIIWYDPSEDNKSK